LKSVQDPPDLYRSQFTPSIEEVIKPYLGLFVYVDGRFLKGVDASVSVWDHGLLYGDGVFEGIRVHDGKLFKLEDHINRLFDSAKGISLTRIPLTKAQLMEVVERTVALNNLRDAHVRPIITRGAGQPGVDPRRTIRPSIIVMAYPFPPLLGDRPARLITASIRRKSPHSVDARIKSLNYLDNILAKLQANVAGMDDALLLDVGGFVAEATGENIFAVLDRTLHTPPTTASLSGITRATVVELAQRANLRVVEKNLVVGDLYVADEVFLTGTGAGIHSVEEMDGRRSGKGAPGPVTTELKRAYDRYVRTERITNVNY
jgi:branched-chain amino acid aminotransferase